MDVSEQDFMLCELISMNNESVDNLRVNYVYREPRKKNCLRVYATVHYWGIQQGKVH